MKRFILQNSENKEFDFVCTDTVNGIVCQFKVHKFNETQHFTLLNDIDIDENTANFMAKCANEMANWLSKNHAEKVF